MTQLILKLTKKLLLPRTSFKLDSKNIQSDFVVLRSGGPDLFTTGDRKRFSCFRILAFILSIGGHGEQRAGPASNTARCRCGFRVLGVSLTASLTRSRNEASLVTYGSHLQTLTEHLYFNVAHHRQDLIGTNLGVQI